VSFLSGLFGGDGNQLMTMLFALGAVLVLIILGVWLLKWILNMSGNPVRGRNRRLAVVDTLAVDQKRQLVIIRRDNVEHLILVGGQQDLIVETGIPVVEQQVAQTTRRPVPTVPARTKPVDPIVPQTEAVEPAPVKPATAIERLQKLGQPANQRGPRSLRHTGLLRPVTAQDDTMHGHNPDKSPVTKADSVKESLKDEDLETAALEQDPSSGANRG
jgi:flagellar protein FliO/FliZ